MARGSEPKANNTRYARAPMIFSPESNTAVHAVAVRCARWCCYYHGKQKMWHLACIATLESLIYHECKIVQALRYPFIGRHKSLHARHVSACFYKMCLSLQARPLRIVGVLMHPTILVGGSPVGRNPAPPEWKSANTSRMRMMVGSGLFCVKLSIVAR